MKLLAVVVIAGCYTSANDPAPATPITPPPPPPPRHTALELTMSTTPCMGRCPIYTVMIHDDNSIEYNGGENVNVVGHQQGGKITPSDRARLIAELDHVQYFKLDESGHLPPTMKCRDTPGGGKTCSTEGSYWSCSDGTSSVFVVSLGERANRTANEHCHESPLDALEALVVEITDVDRWVNGGNRD